MLMQIPIKLPLSFEDALGYPLTRAENCPEDIAVTIGQTVFDYGLGDVRKARGVWQLMTAPTEDEVHRVARLMKKYSRDNHNHRKQKVEANRLL